MFATCLMEEILFHSHVDNEDGPRLVLLDDEALSGRGDS